MLFPLFILMFLTFTTASNPSESSSSSKGDLKSVHVVFRHGDSVLASPKFFPINPEIPHDFDPSVPSDLTNTGRMRAYKLGQYLRSRYNDFLGTEYRRQDVYARSTYLERARASLLLVLAGLYPPKDHQKWHPTLDWQPISIEAPEAEANDPLMWSINCSTYLDERRRHESKPGYMHDFVKFLVLLFKRMDPESKFDDAQLTDMYTKLRDGIITELSTLDWTDIPVNVTMRFAHDAAILRYHAQNDNKKLSRLNGGMLLRKIMDDMRRLKEGMDVMPKINLYAGQEFNVVALLWAIDAWLPIVPTYTSAVILELWKKDDDYYIKVFYHDGLTRETEARTILGCNSNQITKICLFDDLDDLLQRKGRLPNNLSECYPRNEIDNGMPYFHGGPQIRRKTEKY